MGRIVNIHARQILDSRGNPTVEAEVYTDLGVWEELRFLQELQQESMRL